MGKKDGQFRLIDGLRGETGAVEIHRNVHVGIGERQLLVLPGPQKSRTALAYGHIVFAVLLLDTDAPA